MKEVCMQVEDERRHADQFKEQVCLALSFQGLTDVILLLIVSAGVTSGHTSQNGSPETGVHMCAGGKGQLSHEAVEASAGGGGGGSHPSECFSQEAAAGAWWRHWGQRGSEPRGSHAEEPPQVKTQMF